MDWPDHNWNPKEDPQLCSACPPDSLFADDPIVHLYVRLARALSIETPERTP